MATLSGTQLLGRVMMVSRRHSIQTACLLSSALSFQGKKDIPSENNPIVCRKRTRHQPRKLSTLFTSRCSPYFFPRPSKACFFLLPVSAFREGKHHLNLIPHILSLGYTLWAMSHSSRPHGQQHQTLLPSLTKAAYPPPHTLHVFCCKGTGDRVGHDMVDGP